MAIILEEPLIWMKSNVSFSDLSAAGSQYDAINRIATAGLTDGFPDGTFKPNSPVHVRIMPCL